MHTRQGVAVPAQTQNTERRSSGLRMTYAIAYSAGMDAANQSMRAAGRSAWNDEDYALAIRTLDELYPVETHLADSGVVLP